MITLLLIIIIILLLTIIETIRWVASLAERVETLEQCYREISAWIEHVYEKPEQEESK